MRPLIVALSLAFASNAVAENAWPILGAITDR